MSDFLLKSDIAEICHGLGPVAEEFTGKTVLICGGRGFLGRYFVETFAYLNKHALKKPVKLVVLDNLITAGREGAKFETVPHCRFQKHDIIKPFRFKERPDFILQAAGIASPYYYRAFPLETLEVAIQGTKNCLNLARSTGAKILFFSSSEIYGDPDPKHVPTPESYRGNVSFSVVRPFNVYGPGMQETDYRVLPNFANRIKADLPLKVYGSGDQTRTFCYVTDALRGFLLALVKGLPGEAYNIGNPKPEISMVELVRISECVLGRRVKHDVVEYPDSYPADEPNRRCPDITKARLQLGYEPRVPLEEGLRRFYGWADQSYTGTQSA
ncbi:MAG: NAD-dependent epimerase/dehydratase family protein [Elusimicrobia bacterium]|nr:NAD-dependent epimerase/dehydratase family protein [Elusimicrobiota bacterium]